MVRDDRLIICRERRADHDSVVSDPHLVSEHGLCVLDRIPKHEGYREQLGVAARFACAGDWPDSLSHHWPTDCGWTTARGTRGV